MSTNNYLRNSILVGLFAILFIPFIAPYSSGLFNHLPIVNSDHLFFPFITGKNFFFRIVVEVIAALWVILALRDVRFRPKQSWLLWTIVAFVGIMFVADLASPNVFKSFYSNFERMEGWITLAHLGLYFLVASAVLNTEKLWTRFFQTSIGVSIALCFYGFLQLGGAADIHQGSTRLDASLGNSAYLAVYMLFHIFLTAFLLIRRVTSERKPNISIWSDWMVYAYFIAIALQTFTLFYTATRGAILGLLLGAFVTAVLIAITERQNKYIKKASIIGLSLVVAVVVIFLAVKNTNFVKNNEVLSRFSSISLQDSTTQSRFLIWNMAFQGFKESPKTMLIGWGQESFNYVFNKYYNPKMYSQEQWFDRAHDIVFDWLIAGGALGLLTYLAMFCMTVYLLWKDNLIPHYEKSIFTGLLLGYFFHNIFVFDNITSYILFFSVMAYVHYRSVANVSVVHKTIEETIQYGIAIVAVIVAFVSLYMFNYKPIMASRTLIDALSQGPGRELQSLEAFQSALSYNTEGKSEIREQLFTAVPQVVKADISTSTKQGFVQLAQQEAKNQLAETPNDARYQLFVGNLYQQLGPLGIQESIPYLEKAAQLSPTKQTILFTLGSGYFSLGQIDKALAVFKKAYELEPSFDEAKKVYALVGIYAGKNDIAKTLFGNGPVMDPRFVQAYKETKQYDLMMAYLQEQVKEKPQDPQSYLSLAAGYLVIKDRTNAIKVLQQLLANVGDDNAKSQIQSLINDIKAGKNPIGE